MTTQKTSGDVPEEGPREHIANAQQAVYALLNDGNPTIAEYRLTMWRVLARLQMAVDRLQCNHPSCWCRIHKEHRGEFTNGERVPEPKTTRD